MWSRVTGNLLGSGDNWVSIPNAREHHHCGGKKRNTIVIAKSSVMNRQHPI